MVGVVSFFPSCISPQGDRRKERLERMLRANRTAFSKGVVLSGEPAATWLEALCRSPDRRDDLRLAADIYRAQDIALARLWTSASILTNADLHSEGVSITVLTEGEMVLRAGGVPMWFVKRRWLAVGFGGGRGCRRGSWRGGRR
ncbi:hypothetical protein, partial [Rathayibacter iranicus]